MTLFVKYQGNKNKIDFITERKKEKKYKEKEKTFFFLLNISSCDSFVCVTNKSVLNELHSVFFLFFFSTEKISVL